MIQECRTSFGVDSAINNFLPLHNADGASISVLLCWDGGQALLCLRELLPRANNKKKSCSFARKAKDQLR